MSVHSAARSAARRGSYLKSPKNDKSPYSNRGGHDDDVSFVDKNFLKDFYDREREEQIKKEK